MPDYIDNYSEHMKLQEVKDQSQAIGEFLEWLPSQRIHLGVWRGNSLEPSYSNIQDLLAAFFNIDRDKLEDEKKEMLKKIRKEFS